MANELVLILFGVAARPFLGVVCAFFIPVLIAVAVWRFGVKIHEKEDGAFEKRIVRILPVCLRERDVDVGKYVSQPSDSGLAMLVCLNSAPRYDETAWCKEKMPKFYESDFFNSTRELGWNLNCSRESR